MFDKGEDGVVTSKSSIDQLPPPPSTPMTMITILDDEEEKWWRLAWRDARLAQRRALIPSIFLNILALIVCIMYFCHVQLITLIFDDSLHSIQKVLGNYWFPLLSNGLLGGVVPVFIDSLVSRKCLDYRDMILTFLLFGLPAITGNFLYIAFSMWLGDSVRIDIILLKSFIACFIYNPFFSGAIQSFGFHLQTLNFNFADWLTLNSVRAVFPRKYVTNLITGIAMWFPIQSIIFALPLPLQFPICTCFNCIDGVIMIFANASYSSSHNDKKKEEDAEERDETDFTLSQTNYQQELQHVSAPI